MTTTYDPFHPSYFDEPDLRGEMTRVFDVCHGCQRCVSFCPSFPTMFELIDEREARDAARLTPSQQDQVVDGCFDCKLCTASCPYTPEQSELRIDFARLMMRAEQVRVRNKGRTVHERVRAHAVGRADLVGRLGVTLALPRYARQRFSTWFERGRPTARKQDVSSGKVALFATCVIEYQTPETGRDLVEACERNGLDCTLPTGQVCCGEPWLHGGDVEQFIKGARGNIAVLADAVRAGNDLIVPIPRCRAILQHDYVDYVGGPDAALVAANTHDADDYLMRVRNRREVTPDSGIVDEVPPATEL